MKIDINSICEIAVNAGKAILEIYNNPALAGQFESKDDNSPITLADKAANKVIVDALRIQYPQIPILSEEEVAATSETRKSWEYFWVVDPLDGTKEFIKRNGEFTVNIALVQNQNPVEGVIYVPVLDVLYYTENGKAYKKTGVNEAFEIKANLKQSPTLAAGSRSHGTEKEVLWLQNVGVTDSRSKGSSLKFCMVAEGETDIYLRSGPTMEWDTAAGQAIAEASGAKVVAIAGEFKGHKLPYNKEVILNPGFLVWGCNSEIPSLEEIY